MGRKNGYKFLILAAIIMLAIATLATAADWPQWRGPNSNGISAETDWLGVWHDGLVKIDWKESVGTGFSSLSYSDGRVYAMGNSARKKDDENQKDIVYCLDAKSGKIIWKSEYSSDLTPKYYEGGPSATPTIHGGKVYTFSKHGLALCLDALTGEEVWKRDLQQDEKLNPPTWGFAGSVTIFNDLALYNAGQSGIALNKDTGKTVWKSDPKGAGYSTPYIFKIGDKTAAALFTDQEITTIDPATGKVLWMFPWKTNYDVNAAQPIVNGSEMFISSGYKRGCALIKFTDDKAEKIYELKTMQNQCNSSVFWKGHVYGFSGNVGGKGILKCLDFKTGQEKWSKSDLGTGSLMIADNKLIILSESGDLVIAEADPAAFKQLQKAKILEGKCWTVPTLADGRIFARNAAGFLVCVNPRGS